MFCDRLEWRVASCDDPPRGERASGNNKPLQRCLVVMASFPHPHRWGLTRRSTAYLLLFAMVGMLFPLHFHVKPSGIEKDDSTPFPCQNRPCGCRTAQQCWKKCCCFTNAQKVAWAKTHRVRVPEFVVAAAKAETQKRRTCKACCQHQIASNTVRESDAKRPSKASLFVALDQMRCEGVEITVGGALICLPPAMDAYRIAETTVLVDRIIFPEGHLSPVWREPPTPPPKITAV